MKRSASFIATACMLMLSVAPAAGQGVPDLTGTWTGRWSCRSFDGEKFNARNTISKLRITQSGATLAARVDGPPVQFFYNGAIIPDAKKPAEKGEVALNQCGTDNLPLAGLDEAEMVRAAVKTKLTGPKASFTGISVFENTGDLGSTIGTCRYSYKRTDTSDPGVLACP